jgi:hypothetical protein
MSRDPDLREFFRCWPYDPNQNVRLMSSSEGRDIMLVRQSMGLEPYKVDGRLGGLKPQSMEFALDFQRKRLAAAKRAGAEETFRLNAKADRSGGPDRQWWSAVSLGRQLPGGCHGGAEIVHQLRA